MTHQTHAFVAIQDGALRNLVTLEHDVPLQIGSQSDAGIVIQKAGIASKQALIWWDGHQIMLRIQARLPATFVNGKPLSGDIELKAGDEIAWAGSRMVVGMRSTAADLRRHTLSDREFRHRLYEEMARAARRNSPTSLVMVRTHHQEGTRLVSAALQELREGDLLGGYATDEYEILFADTSHEQAEMAMTRLLKAAGISAVYGIATAPNEGDRPERLIRNARKVLSEKSQGKALETPPPISGTDARVLTHDKAGQAILNQLEKIAQMEKGTEVDKGATLFMGEVSSGKALFAKWLHYASFGGETEAHPFKTIMCKPLIGKDPLKVLPIEMFKNACGTILFESIHELEQSAQHHLAEALTFIPKDVRIMSTTEHDLADLVSRNAFREELYERISQHQITILALRDRPDDIIPLAHEFAQLAGAKEPILFSAGALIRLRSFPWLGNVLELRNALERAVRLAAGGEILAEHLPSEVLSSEAGEGRLREHVDLVEREAIAQALADNNFNQTHAAKQLGVSRRTLIYKMEKYGLKPPPGTKKRRSIFGRKS